jgi:hypothetical protein
VDQQRSSGHWLRSAAVGAGRVTEVSGSDQNCCSAPAGNRTILSFLMCTLCKCVYVYACMYVCDVCVCMYVMHACVYVMYVCVYMYVRM